MKPTLLLLCLIWLLAAQPIKVTFVNPGAIDDPFFGRLCSVMESASKDLNVSLEILYSGRDYINGIEIGKEILHRDERPDFLLLINEDGMAERLLIEANKLGVKCILFNEGLSDQFLKEHGNPAEAFEHLIAQVLPNDSLAGYLLAENLCSDIKAPTKANLLALGGSPRTSSAILRKKGLEQYIKENPHIKLLQSIPAHWRQDKATYVTKQAYKRYRKIDVIWSASDLMALGALDALGDKGEVATGGIDWATFAFEEVNSKRFKTTVGGHFFDGAWALILIHDYVKLGKLAKKNYLSNSFHAITSANINLALAKLSKNDWDYIDFKEYSKVYNAKLTQYDFSLEKILQ